MTHAGSLALSTLLLAGCLVAVDPEDHGDAATPGDASETTRTSTRADAGVQADAGSPDATPLPEAAVRAIEAGCDTVLLCNSTIDEQTEAIEALIHAAEFGRLTPARLDDAIGRQQEVKARLATAGPLRVPDIEGIGSEAHQAVAREMARWA